jgi:glucosyl-3-phosphoglycerate synthase
MSRSPVQRWLEDRTFHHSRYDAAWLAANRTESITVCLPARECADTIAEVVQRLVGLRDRGAIDEIVVIDAASADGTAELAARAGATVHQEADLLPTFGPVRGKGDAMWRAVPVVSGELICFLDADTADFSEHFAVGMLGPLVEFDSISFVKAAYRRPFVADGLTVADGGGRVNHLLARPALALFYPELAGLRQPLAGEIAARRGLLESLPFATGYAVEVAMLIDVLEAAGLDAIAQVDLDVRRNAHQALLALSPMAYAVLQAIAIRLERDGRLSGLDPAGLIQDDGLLAVPYDERPPIASLVG